MTRRLRLPIVVILLLAGVAPAFAQAPAGRGGGAPQIQVTSPRFWPIAALPSGSSRHKPRPSGWQPVTFRGWDRRRS